MELIWPRVEQYLFFFFQAEDGIRDAQESRGLGDVYKRQVQEVVEVATTYNLTRVGSRDMYRLIEVVIRQKFADIQKDGQVANTLYTLYTKSALCTPELVEKLGKVAF
eukprot:TRINITY_DN2128_c0_g1_i10.p3 TRINITY_DN2128_c0_g1~~TRINITY_DN2128_c0_g1_i10.p3  ORF type:complete len:108 (+),score=39.81 TRINITY_DN2128_c0_g1_i10:23-346(+)